MITWQLATPIGCGRFFRVSGLRSEPSCPTWITIGAAKATPATLRTARIMNSALIISATICGGTWRGAFNAKHHYCIVDEIDSILVDEARTPLIISGAAEDDTFKFAEVDKLLGDLVEVTKKADGEYPNEAEGEEIIGDYKLNEKNKSVSFTNDGMNKIELSLKKRGIIQGSVFDEGNFEYIHYFYASSSSA